MGYESYSGFRSGRPGVSRMRRIALDDDDDQGLGVVVLGPSGTLYANQCGGLACHHPEAEGTYVPLGPAPPELEAHFAAGKWQGRCYAGIDDDTARFVEDQLAINVFGGEFLVVVDRSRLADSEEAWIFVTILPCEHAILAPHAGARGILVWQNSD